jgi:diguanylate cyclase (GGDEF)-like protein
MAKILLVEDDKIQAKTTKDYLEKTGYEVIWVENGKLAIKTAKTELVDLIVLDVVLPDIDGKEVCRWLKSNKDTKGVPIIILSGKISTKEKVFGLEAGADDYLPKPYDESELKARAYACLRTKILQDELREKNRRLEELLLNLETLAITDSLTGLYNRRYFESVIEKEFNRSTRYGDHTSCLMIDIDQFKKINDEYGHSAGDQVLKEIAIVMKNCLRKIDTMARWGGEEFVVLFPQTNKGGAFKAASRILTSVSTCKLSSGPEQITVSIGLAAIPEPSIDNSEKLIDASDSALYEAKAKGRNRIEVF